MKDSYYFPHFCNARHDRKIKRLKKDLGIEGYGIYFMLLEVLREQTDFRYPLNEVDLLADELGTSEAKVRAVIASYELFMIDEENNFFSLKLIEFLQPYLNMKRQRSIAGKASAEQRRQIKEQSNNRSMDVEQSKVNKSKVNKINKTLEDFKNERQIVFDNFSKEVKEYLARFSITSPLPYSTDLLNEPYNDLVSHIIETIENEEWKHTQQKNHGLNATYFDEFVKHALSGYHTTKYKSGHDFRSHCVNWFNLKKK